MLKFNVHVFKRSDPGIPTGGRERRDFPPLSNIPPLPLLNQHKYYNKVVLSTVTNVAAKGMHLFIIFPKVYSSCQNIGNRHCFLVGGGGGGGGGHQMVFPPFSKNPVRSGTC